LSVVFIEDCKNNSGAPPPPPPPPPSSVQNYEVCEVTREERCIQGFGGISLRPIGRPRRRWEDNIKTDLQEVGWRAWTGLIWLRI